jgi:hypothetical protein
MLVLGGWVRKLYFVVDEGRYFAQQKFPWQSMDCDALVNRLSSFYDVQEVTLKWLYDNFRSVSDSIVLYSSSQRGEHKQFIADLMIILAERNVLIPSYESLLAHDNKGFQTLLASKYKLNYVEAVYYSDVTQVPVDQAYPCVVKTINGASSNGVELAESFEDIKKFICRSDVGVTWQSIKLFLKKYLFRWKFNSDWYSYTNYGRKRFIIQRYIRDLKYDYKVLIFSDKFYVLKRLTRESDFKASGSGLWVREFDSDEIQIVLSAADTFRKSYRSPIYSLDIVVEQGVARIIEFQFTHIGPITLTESEGYYMNHRGWTYIPAPSTLEEEFCRSVIEYLNSTNV